MEEDRRDDGVRRLLMGRVMANFRRHMYRHSLPLAFLTLGGNVVATPVSAQSGPHTLCVTPRPAPQCRAFLLMDVRGQSPFAPDDRPSLHQSLGWDVGLGANVADAWALGAFVGYEFASESTRHRRAGLTIQRWLTRDVSLAFSPGAFELIDKGYAPAPDRTGYSASLDVSLFRVGVVGLRLDVLPERTASNAPSEYAVSAVGGLQNLPALAGSVLGGLVVLIGLGAAMSAG